MMEFYINLLKSFLEQVIVKLQIKILSDLKEKSASESPDLNQLISENTQIAQILNRCIFEFSFPERAWYSRSQSTL